MSLVIGHLSLVICHWLFVIGYLSFVIGCLSLVVCHWLLVICHLLFVVWELGMGNWYKDGC
ncbi:MAG: hypothetical protein F6K31_22565 [Symploca sp. SIO2G7]|nr:hypothetical protein [Symploca sp. SIO2G7]